MPMLRARELTYPMEKARISLALCDVQLRDELEGTRMLSPALGPVGYFGDAAADGLEALMDAASDQFDAVDTAAGDVCLIGFTSGTTGVPKGSMHFHRDLLAVCDAYGAQVLRPVAADRFIGSPPLAFTFGLGGLLLFPLHVGASAVLLERAGPDDLLPAIRVTALRQGIWLTTYETDYGQYLQEMSDASSGLHRFAPNAVLFAFDTPHLLRGVTADMDKASADAAFDEILRGLTDCWQSIHHAFRCPVIQQTALPVFPKLLGSNEHRLPGSRHHMVSRLNAALRDLADRHSVDLLAVDDRAALDRRRLVASCQNADRAVGRADLWRHAGQIVGGGPRQSQKMPHHRS